jgi:hypothetical protein
MRLVIEAREFATLSHDTQQELLDRFAGKVWQRHSESKRSVMHKADLVDLTPSQAAQLVESSSEEDRSLLKLFAQRGGRAKMDELLATSNDTDPEIVSRFVSAITRKVQAVVGEDSQGKSVFVQEPAPEEGSTIYRLSDLTTQSLRCFFPML